MSAKHGPNIHNTNGKPFAAITTIMDGTSRITFEAYGDTPEQARQECDALTTKYRHAPELLEALRSALDRSWNGPLDDDTRDKCAAAIAKAKGTT